MSLDTLFEQILLTEQQVSENIKQLHEGKGRLVNGQFEMSSREFLNVKKQQYNYFTLNISIFF